MLSENFRDQIHQSPESHESFNETLKKDTAADKEQAEGRRISISYATGIVGFVVGILLGMCVGVLCCSRLIGYESQEEKAEKIPLNPKPDIDKMRVI